MECPENNDLLGFVGPFVVKTKTLLQELWSRGYDWDDVIQDDIAERIKEWHQQLQTLGNVWAPRSLRDTKEVMVSKRIITFMDELLQAYRTVVYYSVYTNNDGTVTTQMIASKSKVAPLKPMTVP